jgi:hypothetical protein
MDRGTLSPRGYVHFMYYTMIKKSKVVPTSGEVEV